MPSTRRRFLRYTAAVSATIAGSPASLFGQQEVVTPGGTGAVGPATHALTTSGPVSGYIAGPSASPDNVVAGAVIAFKGIPYGANTADTRFAAPRPPAPWTDVHACTQWGPRAPQVPGARPSPTGRDAAQAADLPQHGYRLPPDEGDESEDCLHLNIWTPSLPANNLAHNPRSRRKLPVMVYIHGGAYSNGTVNAQLYDGARLARRGDVVVVTVNHRLNLFGYLYLAELLPGQGFDDSGNAGQLDLVLALQWVRDNIAAFGGDPKCVMIFGQSGGGAKCATLMAQPPAAAGLFNRVLTMSGQQITGAQPAHASQSAPGLCLKATRARRQACPPKPRMSLRTLPMAGAASCNTRRWLLRPRDRRALAAATIHLRS